MRCIVVLLLFVCTTVLAVDDHERLQRIESLALSDWHTSQILLSDIDVDLLDPENKQYFRYLTVYLSTKDTPLETVSRNYKQLYRDLPDGAVKIKTAKSLLALSAYLSEWDFAFSLSKELEAQITALNDPLISLSAWKGLLVLYSQAGLNDMALKLADKILNSPKADDAIQCFAKSMAEEIRLSEALATEQGFNQAIELCKRAGQSYYVTFNYVHLLDLFVTNKAFNKAKIIEKEAKWRVDDSQFVHMTSSFKISQSLMRMSEGKIDEAEAFALEVIKLDTHEEFKAGLSAAYDILVTITSGKNEFDKAFSYLQKKQKIEQALTTENSIKELAYQKAMFDLSNKESEILLLDKQNKLLQAEAKYNGQKMKTTILALSMVSVIGVALLLWSYRSRKLARKLRYLATRDSLTGLYNRGYFTDLANDMLKRAQKNKSSVTMLLLDLDLFKGLNDTYGHQVGDWVLREVARTLQRCCHKQGVVTRMGGEEFGLLVENMTVEQGFELAETCRQAIENIDSNISGHKFTVSASFGVSGTQQVGYSLDNLFSASDLALYQSKRFGRNQVYEYNKTMSPLG